MTDLARSPAEAILQTLERRLAREAEAFAERPLGFDLGQVDLVARAAKRLADAARSLVDLRTALTRLAQAAAGRAGRAAAPIPAPISGPDQASEVQALAIRANRAERRRAERLESRLRREVERLAA